MLYNKLQWICFSWHSRRYDDESGFCRWLTFECMTLYNNYNIYLKCNKRFGGSFKSSFLDQTRRFSSQNGGHPVVSFILISAFKQIFRVWCLDVENVCFGLNRVMMCCTISADFQWNYIRNFYHFPLGCLWYLQVHLVSFFFQVAKFFFQKHYIAQFPGFVYVRRRLHPQKPIPQFDNGTRFSPAGELASLATYILHASVVTLVSAKFHLFLTSVLRNERFTPS